MNPKQTRLFAFFAAVLMVLSAGIPLLAYDSDATGLPSEFDLSEKGFVTPVRDQAKEGVCWSFGLAATLETELIRKGITTNDEFVSPLYLDIQDYDGYEKDYRGGDYNSLYNQGMMNTMGGTLTHDLQLLANWKSPVAEYLAPYEEFFVDYYSVDRTLSSLALVKGIKVLNPYTDAAEIKNMICNDHHGGMFVYSADSHSQSPVDNRFCFYIPDAEGNASDHSVELVGWDDNFPKEYMRQPNGDIPSSNGAWLVKNSWGGKEITGSDGFAWVSYESVIDNVMFITDMDDNDGNQHLYSYDHGYSCRSNLFRSGSATMANIFTSERNETLTGVSISMSSFTESRLPSVFDQEYVVKVYKLGEGYENPTDGKLIYTSGSGVANSDGLFYVKFSNGLDLKAGEKFSVCVELTGSRICLPVDTTETTDVGICHTVAKAGQSYYLSDNGNWTDLSADCMSNFRIKAYTESNPSGMVAKVTNGAETKEYASLDEAIKNVEKDGTVTLLCSVELQNTLEITGKTDLFVLNLNGFVLSCKGDVVSVIDCQSGVWITQGMIKSSDNAGSAITVDSSKNVNLSRVYLDSQKNCVTATSGAAMKLQYCTYNNSKDSDAVLKVDGISKVSVEMYYPADSSITGYYLCDVESDGTLELNEGKFFGDMMESEPLIYAGEFLVEPTSLYYGSSCYKTKDNHYIAGIDTLEYTNANGKARTFDLSYAYADTVDGNITLLEDYFSWNPMKFDLRDDQIPVTIDLRGHNMTVMRDLLSSGYTDVTIINSSSTRSSIECASIGHVAKLHIGSNMDIATTRYLVTDIDKEGIELDVSNLSTAYHKNDRGISQVITVPYSKDGKYCETVMTVTYREDRSTIEKTTVEEIVYTALDRVYSRVVSTFTSTTTYADGSVETAVGSSSMTKTTKADGTVVINGSAATESGLVMQYDLTEGGNGHVIVRFSFSAETGITADIISKVVDDINVFRDKYVEKAGCKNVDYFAVFAPSTVTEFTIEEDAVRLLADNGINLYASYKYGLLAISHEALDGIHGDLTFGLETMNASNTSERQSHVIDGNKIAYAVTMKVDGHWLNGKLNGNVSVSITLSRPMPDMKVYRVTDDGKFDKFDAKIVGTSVAFDSDQAGTFVLCEQLDDDDVVAPTKNGSDYTGVWIAIGVMIATLIVVAMYALVRMLRDQ